MLSGGVHGNELPVETLSGIDDVFFPGEPLHLDLQQAIIQGKTPLDDHEGKLKK